MICFLTRMELHGQDPGATHRHVPGVCTGPKLSSPVNVLAPNPWSFMRNRIFNPGLEMSRGLPSSCQPNKEVAAWLDSQEGPAGPCKEPPTPCRLGRRKRKGVPRCVLETNPRPP